jgi:hypothetical protein
MEFGFGEDEVELAFTKLMQTTVFVLKLIIYFQLFMEKLF